MKQIKTHPNLSRRTFLRGTVLTSTGAAVAAAVPGVAMASVTEAETEPNSKHKGYHLTQHIVDYYKTAAS